MEHFFVPLLDGSGSQSATILESKSHLKIDQKINVFWIDFLTILRLSWGPCGVPFGFGDATGTPPRRSKTLSRGSPDAPKTLKDANKAPQEAPKRAQHTSKLDFG